MTLGVVYCAESKSFPGRCKIGKTFRHPDQRIAELQRHYGCAYPFTKHDKLLVDHYSRVEWLVHQRLAHCREPATEMFRCTPEQAMAAIRWAADEALRNPPRYQPRPAARPRTLAKGRGIRFRKSRWLPTLAAAAVLIATCFFCYRSALPEALLRTADRMEHWLQ